MKFRYINTNGDDCLKKLQYFIPIHINDSHEVLIPCDTEPKHVHHTFISCTSSFPFDLVENPSSSIIIDDSIISEILDEFDEEKFFELEQVILDDFVDFDFTRELEVKRIYVDKPMQNFIEEDRILIHADLPDIDIEKYLVEDSNIDFELEILEELCYDEIEFNLGDIFTRLLHLDTFELNYTPQFGTSRNSELWEKESGINIHELLQNVKIKEFEEDNEIQLLELPHCDSQNWDTDEFLVLNNIEMKEFSWYPINKTSKERIIWNSQFTLEQSVLEEITLPIIESSPQTFSNLIDMVIPQIQKSLVSLEIEMNLFQMKKEISFDIYEPSKREFEICDEVFTFNTIEKEHLLNEKDQQIRLWFCNQVYKDEQLIASCEQDMNIKLSQRQEKLDQIIGIVKITLSCYQAKNNIGFFLKFKTMKETISKQIINK